MTMRLPRPRHGDPKQTTAELRELAASILRDDVETLARTTAYLRRSYRVVFVGYVAMMVFGVAAIAAAFVKGLTASSIGPGRSGDRPRRADGRHLRRVLRPTTVGGARAKRDLHALGLDRPDDVLDSAPLPRRPGDARREARTGGQGGLRRAERDRVALRGDRRQGAGGREGGGADAPGQAAARCSAPERLATATAASPSTPAKRSPLRPHAVEHDRHREDRRVRACRSPRPR